MTRLASLIERRPRYMVMDHSAVEVEIQASDHADAEVSATLLDISAGGAKLKTNQQVPQGQTLALQFNSPELSGQFGVDATVCWTQLGGRGEWIVGCSFQPEIPSLILDKLATVGVFDRREDERKAVSISSTAAWQLASHADSVCIIDISSRGFCLVSQQPGRPGSHVMLKFADTSVDVPVTGRCRWQIKADNGYTLGCEFSSSDDYQNLRRIQVEHDARLTLEKRGLLHRLFGG